MSNIESEGASSLSPEKSERLQSSSEDITKISDDAVVINYIMLARIYDLLCVIGDSLGKGEDIINLIELHKQGQLMSPPPVITTSSNEA